MISKTLPRSFATVFLFGCSLVQADAALELNDPMVVTAARSEQSASEALSAVTVIDRDAIERSQAPDMIELLRLQAGIDISRAGGPGAQTSIFLRGTNSNHTLVLIDGVRVASAGTGAFAWETLDVASIERIEIVRGPRAARWGSDAIGGVIQIFSRRPETRSARVSIGSFGDRRISITGGNQDFNLTASRRTIDGFSAQNPNGFAFDPDDDGLVQNSATLRTQRPIGAGVLAIHARFNQGETEFDRGESELLNYSGGLDYQLSRAQGWSWSAQLLTLRDRLESVTAFGESELITRRLQASLQAEQTLTNGLRVLIGADAWDESGESRDSWDDNRSNLGAWTGIDGRFNHLDVEASLRVDRDSEFGSELTGNLATGWDLSDQWRVQANLGRGFRSPTFNQLFSPGFFGAFAGNPDLGPETSTSIEFALSWQATGQRAGLNIFQTKIDDLIDFAGTDFQAINIRRARIQGVELTHQLRLGSWLVNTQASWQDSEDRETRLELLRRARFKASTRVDYMMQNGSWIGTELLHSGSRQDVGQQTLESYTLVNISAGMTLSPHWRLEGRIDNLGDRQYEPLVGFNAPGRAAFLALRWMH